MKRLLIAIVLAFLVLQAGAWALPTTDFNNAFTNGVAQGWTAVVLSQQGTFSQGTGITGSGQMITTAGDGNDEAFVYGVFAVERDIDWEISVMVNGAPGNAGFAVKNGNTHGSNPNTNGADWAFCDALGWTQMTLTGHSTNNSANYVTVYMDDWGNSGAIFDDLTGVVGSPLTSVPEPGSLVALASGLLGFVGIIRRRK